MQPYTENRRQLRKLGAEAVVFPKEKHINWSFNAKMVSLEDIHTSNIIRTEKVIFKNMCSYMKMQ